MTFTVCLKRLLFAPTITHPFPRAVRMVGIGVARGAHGAPCDSWRNRFAAERGVWWPRACAWPLLTRWAPAGGVVLCVLASPGRPVCRCAARLTFACVLGRVFGLPEATEPPFRRSAFAHCSSDQGAIANPGCAAACVLYSCLCRLLLWLPRCGCAPGFWTICGRASTPGALSVIGRSKAWYELIS